jgi:hypothetical protein
MMVILTSMALSLVRTEDSMAIPCSVKAYGQWRRPPRLEFEVAKRNLKLSASGGVSWNIKSAERLDSNSW